MTIYDTLIVDFQDAERGDFSKVSKEDFEKLNAEILDEFGLDEIGQMVFFKTRTLVKLQIRQLIDENVEDHIKIAERELSNLTSKFNIEDTRKLHARNHRILQKWSGRDTKKLTVFEYYNDLRDYQKELRDASPDKQRQDTKTGYSR